MAKMTRKKPRYLNKQQLETIYSLAKDGKSNTEISTIVGSSYDVVAHNIHRFEEAGAKFPERRQSTGRKYKSWYKEIVENDIK